MRTRREALCVAALLLGGAAQGKERPVSDPLSLQCALSRDGAVLRVQYTARNQGAERVYLLDDMVKARDGAFLRTPLAMVVQQGAPGTVQLLRAFVDPGHPVQLQYAPAARALDPGQSLSGSAELALPLAAAHPYGRPVPLSGTPTSAVVTIGYLAGKADWISYPLREGGSATAPSLQSALAGQRLLRCAPLPIPAR